MKSPDKIPGLKIWIDASDTTTINNGTIQDRQNVFKIVDKVSGLVFRNGYGIDGPTYSYRSVNNNNAITYNYYTSPNTVLSKGLWCGNVTQMATGTYSLYISCFPFDNRQRNADGFGVASQQSLHILSLIDSLPTGSLTNFMPNRNLVFRSTGGVGIGASNSSPTFREDIDNVFGGTDASALFDKLNTLNDFRFLPQSDNRYIYGKTNIICVRSRSELKKFSTFRNNYTSLDNFQTRATSVLAVTPPREVPIIAGGPWLTIGAILPNQNTTSVDSIPGPIVSTYPLTGGAFPAFNVYSFEGYFCEFLFYDRVLSDSESNAVEDYLKSKWIN